MKPTRYDRTYRVLQWCLKKPRCNYAKPLKFANSVMHFCSSFCGRDSLGRQLNCRYFITKLEWIILCPLRWMRLLQMKKNKKKQGDIDALPIFKSRLKIMLLHLTVFSFHFSFYFYYIFYYLLFSVCSFCLIALFPWKCPWVLSKVLTNK